MSEHCPEAGAGGGVRQEVHFSGQVQGVGFRLTTYHVARGFEVTGYVKNLADGRVEVVAEGSSREVDRFIEAIQKRMGSFISDRSTAASSASGEFRGFDVRY